jgi:hypothetical protein
MMMVVVIVVMMIIISTTTIVGIIGMPTMFMIPGRTCCPPFILVGLGFVNNV